MRRRVKRDEWGPIRPERRQSFTARERANRNGRMFSSIDNMHGSLACVFRAGDKSKRGPRRD